MLEMGQDQRSLSHCICQLVSTFHVRFIYNLLASLFLSLSFCCVVGMHPLLPDLVILSCHWEHLDVPFFFLFSLFPFNFQKCLIRYSNFNFNDFCSGIADNVKPRASCQLYFFWKKQTSLFSSVAHQVPLERQPFTEALILFTGIARAGV